MSKNVKILIRNTKQPVLFVLEYEFQTEML